jgi:hypothetical protein
LQLRSDILSFQEYLSVLQRLDTIYYFAVSGKDLAQLEDNYKREKVKRPNLSFAAFVSESALIELERRKILREAQFILLIGFGDDSVILKDVRKDGKLIEVQIRSKNLKCLHDDSSECIHVGFALALPEVRKVLNK